MNILKIFKFILRSKDCHFLSVDVETYRRWKPFIKLVTRLNKVYIPCEIYRIEFKSIKNFVVIGLRGGKRIQRRTNGWAKKFLIKSKGAKCLYCDCRLSNENVTADHIIPISKCGNNSQVNLVACCRRCNIERGNKSFYDFLRIKNKDILFV